MSVVNKPIEFGERLIGLGNTERSPDCRERVTTIPRGSTGKCREAVGRLRPYDIV